MFMGHDMRVTREFLTRVMFLLNSLCCPTSADAGEEYILLKVVDNFIDKISTFVLLGDKFDFNNRRTNTVYSTSYEDLADYHLDHYFGTSIQGRDSKALSSSILDAKESTGVGYSYIDLSLIHI